MLIVDSQVHTWTGGTPPAVHRPGSFTNDELIRAMDAAGVDRVVLVPPKWDPGAIAHAEVGVQQHPDRFALMCGLPFDQPDGPALLAGWRQAGRLGLRLTFTTPEQMAALRDGAAEWIWATAERHGIPIMLAIWGRLAEAVPIAARHPGLRLVIDHLGIPVTQRTRDDDAFSDMPAVLELARHDNVAIKASGLAAHSTEAYPFRNIHRHLRQAYDAFGPHRTFWGSDLTRMPCSYRQCLTLFTEELPWLSGDELELVMGRSLCEWIGWDMPA